MRELLALLKKRERITCADPKRLSVQPRRPASASSLRVGQKTPPGKTPLGPHKRANVRCGLCVPGALGGRSGEPSQGGRPHGGLHKEGASLGGRHEEGFTRRATQGGLHKEGFTRRTSQGGLDKEGRRALLFDRVAQLKMRQGAPPPVHARRGTRGQRRTGSVARRRTLGKRRTGSVQEEGSISNQAQTYASACCVESALGSALMSLARAQNASLARATALSFRGVLSPRRGLC